MMDDPLPLLLVGDAGRDEFRDATAWLLRRGATQARDIAQALTLLDGGLTPAAIVVAQASPGRFSSADIERLRRAAPLARVVTLLGTWLEGETRSGKPWPAALRVYWHGWPRRHASLRRARLALFDRHMSAGHRHQRRTHPGRLPTVARITRPTSHARHLRPIARYRRGASGNRPPNELAGQHPPVDIALVDASHGSESAVEPLRRCKQALGDVPILAITGFPRIDQVRSLQSAGASAVLSKPFLVNDLLWHLNRLC
jgi:CheY-like chemotaxis protein